MSEERAPYDLCSEARDHAAIGLDEYKAKQKGYIGRMAERLTSTRDLLARALPLLAPPVEPEVPELPPEEEAPGAPTWSLLSGFTAPRHWSGEETAIDWYANKIGTGIAWPVGGTVEGLRLPGPTGTFLYTALLHADNGLTYGLTHVLPTIRTGRVEAGEVFAAIGDSGVEVFSDWGEDPAHIHLTVSAHGPTANNLGDRPALAEIQRLGFTPEIVPRIPSPDDYAQGRAVAGRFV